MQPLSLFSVPQYLSEFAELFCHQENFEIFCLTSSSNSWKALLHWCFVLIHNNHLCIFRTNCLIRAARQTLSARIMHLNLQHDLPGAQFITFSLRWNLKYFPFSCEVVWVFPFSFYILKDTSVTFNELEITAPLFKCSAVISDHCLKHLYF